MATKNFLFFSKCSNFVYTALLVAAFSFGLSACESIQTRDQIKSQPAVKKAGVSSSEVPEALRPNLDSSPTPPINSSTTSSSTPIENEKETPSSSAALAPKIGLILGPGAARAYAHVGVVEELAKARLPITHVVGIEMGALVGAIYASKAQPFDVEWQMFKLKDFKSTQPLIQGVFQNQKTEDLKLPFACPAYNMQKQQNFMMNKGLVSQMLPYCLAYPPSLKPYNQNVAGVTELKAAIDYLKAKGANYIVYVHVLNAKAGVLTGGIDDEANVYWNLVAQSLSKQWQSVDYVISVPVQDFDLANFDQRRQILQKGLEAGQSAASQIARRLGL